MSRSIDTPDRRVRSKVYSNSQATDLSWQCKSHSPRVSPSCVGLGHAAGRVCHGHEQAKVKSDCELSHKRFCQLGYLQSMPFTIVVIEI